ncbi:MAG: cysteine hydrolase [Alicyclobacillus sp.]|nr:cysteine hydrolase [Alicyclobacillus sp.]
MSMTEALLADHRCALVLIDLQNDFCHPQGSHARRGSATDAEQILPQVERLLAAARAAGVLVVFVQTIHEPATDSPVWASRGSRDVCRRGTWGAEWFGVQPLPDEPVVVKHRYSAFYNTRLETLLRARGIETLVLCGVATNVCVETTARDAFMRDYYVVVAGDACATYSLQAHDQALANVRRHFGHVADSSDICKIWEASLVESGRGE